MSKTVKAVIGANYGDEGKGLMSRYFAINNDKPIVILHNGTSQRGHTVENDNFRHVLHHFGGGTLDGVPSFFASTFLVNPLMFEQEYKQLEKYEPEIYVDKNCQIINCLDMFIDQITADSNWEVNEPVYGSCACGSWSATDRIKTHPEYNLTVNDLVKFGTDAINVYLSNMYENYFYGYLDFIRGVHYLPEQWEKLADTEVITDVFIEFKQACEFFMSKVKVVDFDYIYNNFNTLIFEGAQGLLLDMDNEDMEGWTTSSHTGLHNVVKLLGDREYDGEACYVTRSYLTRHGDGPFKEENKDMFFEDVTNVTNKYQGSLRFGNLNVEELHNRINKDCADTKFKSTIALTHINEYRVDLDCTYAALTKYAEDIIVVENK